MKASTKKIGVLTVSSLVLLAGCGNGAEEGSTGNEDNGQITLTVWDYFENDAAHGRQQIELLEAYEEENPHITFERTYVPNADLNQRISQGIAGNQLPDIVLVDNPAHQAFAEAGAFADITEEVEEWGEAEHYYEGAWESTIFDGRNYGIPNNSNALALFYNVDMLEEAGITEPPDTWEELEEVASQLTTDDRYGFAFSAVRDEQGTFQYLPFLWQAGADLDSLSSPEAISSMELLQQMIDEGSMSENVINWDQQDLRTHFQLENVAMMVNGPWQVPNIRNEAEDLNWDVVTMPAGNQEASILGGENWAITSASEHKEEAWEFLKYTQQPEILGPTHEDGGRLPSRVDVGDDDDYIWNQDEQLRVFIDQLETAQPRAYGSNYPEISTIIQESLQRSLMGEDVEEVLNEADERVTPLLP